MITAGIDVGCKTVKALILKDSEILASGVVLSDGFERNASIRKLWEAVLHKAALRATEVEQVIATGTGKYDVPFANDHIVEIVADVKAALWLFPTARSVIDVGAEQTRAAVFDANGKVLDYVLNEKCGAGLGAFFEAMARALEMSLEEMGALSFGAESASQINAQCAAFAMLDVVSLIHNNSSKGDIARSINHAIATKMSATINEITVVPSVVFIGGCAKNNSIASFLSKRLGVDFQIPKEPVLAGALGSALVAAANIAS